MKSVRCLSLGENVELICKKKSSFIANDHPRNKTVQIGIGGDFSAIHHIINCWIILNDGNRH